jgi:hypothetical protein
MDSFLADRGLTPADLPLPNRDGTPLETQSGATRLSVDDASPWYITIHNRTSFATQADLAGYITSRSIALADLAQSDPRARVQAVVHPRDRTSVTGFLSAIACPCDGVNLIVDVYGPDGWMMSAGSDLSGLRVRESATAIESMILDQAAFSLDMFPGVVRADLRAELRMVRLSMTARSAAATSSLPDVLLVDLVTDIERAFVGRAAVVVVAGMPDVAEAYRRIVLADPIGADPVEPSP